MLLVLLFIIPVVAGGQQTASIGYYIDMAQFRINDSLNLAEIYFAIPRKQFSFIMADSGLQADIELRLDISKENKHLLTRTWSARSFARTEEESRENQMLFSVSSFQMKKGLYQFRACITDAHNQIKGETDFELEVIPFVSSSLALSDIQLASEIKRTQVKSIYYKNGYQVVPNPSGIYGDGMPILMFYAEIYNLSYPSDSTYTVHYRVYDSAGRLIKSLPPKTRRISGKSLVEIGGFNVISLPSGTYTLEIEVKDNDNGEIARRFRKFFIYRSRDQVLEKPKDSRQIRLQAMSFYYQDKSEKELDEEFDAARWIATKEELSIYPSLDLEGKREFLAKFWQKRDTDTTTVRNEFREEYLSRVQYAKENFGGFKPGWRTDRGRVLLIYGRPDEVERFPSSNNVRAYEIWHFFNLEGGVQFVFVDIRGWGDFELVHSTARSELNDPDWRRWLRPAR